MIYILRGVEIKVVINKCFGGFSISALAIKRLAELQGRPCFFFLQDWKNGLHAPLVPTTAEDIAATDSRIGMFSAYDVQLPEIEKHKQEDWCSLSDEEKVASNEWHDKHSFDMRPRDRADANLIQVIEELGVKAAGGFADLKIVEIPDGTNYEIDEYDGMESIHEVHQSWD